MKQYKILLLLLALALYPRAQAQTATVSWTTTHQIIDGFGASNANGWALTNSQDSVIFNTLGYSLLRLAVNSDGSCRSISQACALNGANESYFSSPIDAQYCAGVAGCRVWATSWGPPASYTTTGSANCSPGNGTLSSAHYQDYANYLSNYIASLKQYYGVTLFGLSVQNEPGICITYPSSLWSASLFDTFIKTYLVPTLQTNGQGGTKIIMPESERFNDMASHASACMDDSACANLVYANSFHDYDVSTSVSNPYPTTQLWQTEYWTGSSHGFTSSIADGIARAERIHYLLTSGVSAYHWWNLVSDAPPYLSDQALIAPSQSPSISARAYVIAQWSKFVRPGWVRIEATASPTSGVYITAFKETASGSFAIVAINHNAGPVNVELSLLGFPEVTSVTPTLTSTGSYLEDQGTVTISGDTFSYSLPGTSVTTFHGTASGSNTSKAPVSPTNLAAIVN